jgi:hypothetical protein
MKPHPPPHKIRKTIKWGGAAVTVLLVVVWIGSIDRRFEWGGCGPRHLGWAIDDRCACLSFVTSINGLGPDWSIGLPPAVDRSWGFGHETNVVNAAGSLRAASFPSYSQEIYSVALWIPASIVLGMSAAVWYVDGRIARRQRMGRCPKCNYDRAGIGAGAVCPECGAVPRGDEMAHASEREAR